jgi:hypothetical protein
VVLHPGHISGPGWPVITPAGNLDPATWTALATGTPLALPDHGLGILHHVHADDVAQAFERALSTPAAIGASFHVVAEDAMTQRGLAAGAAAWFGREAVLDFVGWEEFTRRVGPEQADVTREHTTRTITASARNVLGYVPRYSSLDALHEALAWLVANGQADIGGRRSQLLAAPSGSGTAEVLILNLACVRQVGPRLRNLMVLGLRGGCNPGEHPLDGTRRARDYGFIYFTSPK